MGQPDAGRDAAAGSEDVAGSPRVRSGQGHDLDGAGAAVMQRPFRGGVCDRVGQASEMLVPLDHRAMLGEDGEGLVDLAVALGAPGELTQPCGLLAGQVLRSERQAAAAPGAEHGTERARALRNGESAGCPCP
jgi:hypothetical protein